MKTGARILIRLALAVSAALGGAAHATVEGYVDMHLHLMGEHAFGGSWFGGTSEDPMQSALGHHVGNTALVDTDTFVPVTTTGPRILGRSGSAAQPGYVRINESAVY